MKITSRKLILLMIISFVSGYLIRSTLEITKESKVNTIPEEEIKSNVFDINKVKVGQKIGEMKVVKIGHYSENVKNVPLSSNVKISFSAKVLIAGTYFFDAPMGAVGPNGAVKLEDYNKVCMSELSVGSLNKIPKPKTKTNDLWFCFTNTEFAFKQFGPVGSKGKATVVFDNYTINVYPSEVTDTAELLWAFKESMN